MQKFINWVKSIPWYVWCYGVFFFALQYGLYLLANVIAKGIGTFDHAFLPKIDVIDNHIPLVPVFIIPYVLSYPFWILAPIVAYSSGREKYGNYLVGLLIAYFIGFLLFIFVPSYMDREAEGLYEAVSGRDPFKFMLRTIYNNDGGTIAYNLFPSYHCLISTYAYLSVCRKKTVNKYVRLAFLLLAISIVLSTVFTKQHYIIDSIVGVSISVICYLVVGLINPGKKIAEYHDKRAAKKATAK